MSRRESDTEYELPIEDDWFATPEDGGTELPFDELVPADEVRVPERRPPSSASDHRPLVIIGGIVAAVALIVVAVVLARAISGSDGGETSTVPTIETPTATTPTTPTPPPASPPAATPPAASPPAASPPAANAGTLPTDVTLRPGDSGDSVQALQQALTQLGYEPGTVDGSYGPATQAAVLAFQQAAEITADGVAGPETLAALNSALATTG
jgi:hypothetical protein